ncbi:MAG: metal-dependent hydrolase [Nocardioidaceae bacterium]
MRGHTHALTGLAAGAAALPLVPVTGGAGQLGWIVAVAGMALLPDLDHPESTAARTWGPATRLLAHGLGAAAGGHRGGTHDPILAPLTFAGLAWAASWTLTGRVIVLAVAIGLALAACRLIVPGHEHASAVVNLGLSGAGGWWLATHSGTPGCLPVAVGLGVLVHIAGDALTGTGIPLPVTWIAAEPRRIGLSLLTTGGAVERYALAPGLLLTAGWLAWIHLHAATHLDQLADTIGGLL